MTTQAIQPADAWPSLPLEAWSNTCATLHLWLQMIGKIKLAQTPWLNHSWHVTLRVTPRGVTTLSIPYGGRTFQIDLDFIDHQLTIQTNDGRKAGFALEPQSVATFYKRLMETMAALDLQVTINRRPCELVDPIRFNEDEIHNAYDADYVNRFWRILVQADRVFSMFRTRFIGKCSPVHLFWGAQDLAVTRFSGRRAPLHRGGIPNLPDWVTQEAYSHEVSSCGFWPGGNSFPYAAFYSYAYPEPMGFSRATVQPSAAFYSKELSEFILPYDAMRESASPNDTLLNFLQTTYEAAATLGKWDRAALERDYAAKKEVHKPIERDR